MNCETVVGCVGVGVDGNERVVPVSGFSVGSVDNVVIVERR